MNDGPPDRMQTGQPAAPVALVDAPAAAPSLAELGLENFPPYLMNRIMGRYNVSLREEMAALGLTTPQMRALAVLSVHDGLLIRELVVYAVVEQSTLSRALDALVKAGLVTRTPDPHDNRATRMSITAPGRAAYERLWPHMAASCAQMFRGIPQAEQQTFTATLQKMLRNIRKHDF
ncbi:DNA-binding transcriptional regulator, MarR family [Roseivivax lentus]|uniref:DNA-binding transcriptional regulator, MarR family n=1 Tax=Roseivivax lentus TaxID=633194 RepID=A0A1N7PU99_9RHOB|nr:MarR family winged helix-turn-helix transcriptional regulator [Roseivivax lentus]SIT14017.1 DNA-binding transcriptional regulator, MarR family [Roseivivax lentus]